MIHEELLSGFNFVLDNDLAHSEVEIFIQLMSGGKTREELAHVLKKSKHTIHGVVQRMKLKGVITGEKNKNKEIVYELCSTPSAP